MIGDEEAARARRAAVVAMAQAGLTNEAIAEAVGASSRTVCIDLTRAQREGVEFGDRRRRARWAPERDAELLALWAQRDPELSATEIGERMRLSKNAVVGRLHRLKVEGRPSPIKRGADGPRPARPSPLAPGEPTLEALPSLRGLRDEVRGVRWIAVSIKEIERFAAVEELPVRLDRVNAYRAERGLPPFALAPTGAGGGEMRA